MFERFCWFLAILVAKGDMEEAERMMKGPEKMQKESR